MDTPLGFLVWWSSWPAVLNLVFAAGTLVSTYLRRDKAPRWTLTLQMLAVAAFILAIPGSLLTSLFDMAWLWGPLALSLRAVQPLLWLSVAAGVIALVVLVLEVVPVGRAATFAAPGAASPPVVVPDPVSHYDVGAGADFRAAPVAPTVADGFTPTLAGEAEPAEEKTVMLGNVPTALPVFAYLVELTGPTAGTAHPLATKRVRLGRGADADVRLVHDQAIHRDHAALQWHDQDQTFVLHDLASTNGVYLQGQPLHAPTPLQEGCRIRVGQTTLYYMQVDAVAPLSKGEA